MSIYTIKLNHPDNNDFQLLGVVTKEGMENEESQNRFIGYNLNDPFARYKNMCFDHDPWLVPERDAGNEKTEFIPVREMESLEKIEVRVISAKLTRSFSGDSFTATVPPDHPMRDLIFPYRTGIYIFENNVLIWKGEVSRTVKKLSGELTVEAIGMTDVLNYYCPIPQTFRNTSASDIAKYLIGEYYITVPFFRFVCFSKNDIINNIPNVILGEFEIDGTTPLLSILNNLSGGILSNKKYYTVMVPSPGDGFELISDEYDDNDIFKETFVVIPKTGDEEKGDARDPVTIRNLMTPYVYEFATLPLIKCGGVSGSESADDYVSDVFSVKYGENLIDLNISKNANGATTFLYQADSVDVISPVVHEKSMTDKSEDDDENNEDTVSWQSEAVPLRPNLYKLNTSMVWNHETEKWEEDGETVHPIRYADWIEIGNALFPAYMKNDPGRVKTYISQMVTSENDDYEAPSVFTPNIEEAKNGSGYVTPDRVKFNEAHNDYGFMESPDAQWSAGGYTDRDDDVIAMLGYEYISDSIFDAIRISGSSVNEISRGYIKKDSFVSFSPPEYHYINVSNNNGAVGTIISQDVIKLEGVNDFQSLVSALSQLSLPPAVSTSYSCEAVDLSLFNGDLVKAELGGYAKVSATPNSEEFTGVITSITYDIVNSKKSVSIQKESESITDILARILNRGTILEKRFAVKSDKKDITDAEIKRGDVIFIPE